MYEEIRARIEHRYGSINKLSKIIGIAAGDLYLAFAGTKPMYPKYKKLIAQALDCESFEKLLEAPYRDCKTCVYSNMTESFNGCTRWDCEYINRDEAVEAWKEKQERSAK